MSATPSASSGRATASINPSRRRLYHVRQHLDRNARTYLSGARPTCPYCGKSFATDKACSQQRSQQAECLDAERAAIQQYMRELADGTASASTPLVPPVPSPTEWGPWTYATDMPPSQTAPDAMAASTSASSATAVGAAVVNPTAPGAVVGDSAEGAAETGVHEGGNSQSTEEYVEYYPNHSAGAPLSAEPIGERDLAAYIGSCGPFAEQKLFEAAELLATSNLTNNERTRFLESKLYRGQVLWHNNWSMMLNIDELPTGPKWSSYTFVVEGIHDTYLLHSFQRDIIEVICELMGDPTFKSEMRYAPERQWTSADRLARIYNDMWTGDWWWELQLELDKFDPSGTIVALIVSSDKSCVSMTMNSQYIYPVYVTLGNISKATRRKSSSRAVVLLGYLPVESFRNEPAGKRSTLRQQSVHKAMRAMFAPLRDAWKDGVEMRCADGHIRRVHPTMAVFEGDWPEQCDMAQTLASGCPMCEEEYQNRGDLHFDTPMRDPDDTLTSLLAHQKASMLKIYRLRPGWPFWADLWPTNFHEAIVPDLLHQIYIGMYKDHIVEWAQKLLGKTKLDRRFAAMTPAHRLRHFNYGISSVQRWTGRESREMAKVILPVIADTPGTSILKAITPLLNFCYLSHLASMTDSDLAELRVWLECFHEHKDALEKYIGLKGWKGIPKLHMLTHYPWSTCRFGVPDGYSTETPERLHREYAKAPWCKSGRRPNAVPRMVKLLQRKDALRLHRAQMDEFYRPKKRVRVSREVLEDIEEDDGDGAWEDEVDGSTGAYSSSGDYHPEVVLLMGKKAHKRGVQDDDAEREHEVSGIGKALQHCLSAYVETESNRLLIRSLTTHHFRLDIWHRLRLAHPRLPFVRHEPPQIDVVRARPPTRSPLGTRIVKSGRFDTVLIESAP